jgi:hypothetical protein
MSAPPGFRETRVSQSTRWNLKAGRGAYRARAGLSVTDGAAFLSLPFRLLFSRGVLGAPNG